jgi:hypothetical protein
MTAAARDRKEHQRRELDGEQLRHLGENVRLHGWGGAVQEALQVGRRHPLLHPLPAHGPVPVLASPRVPSPPLSLQPPPQQFAARQIARANQEEPPRNRTGGIQPNPPALCASVLLCKNRARSCAGEIEARRRKTGLLFGLGSAKEGKRRRKSGGMKPASVCFALLCCVSLSRFALSGSKPNAPTSRTRREAWSVAWIGPGSLRPGPGVVPSAAWELGL